MSNGMRICFSCALLVGMITFTIWVSQKLSQNGQSPAFVTFVAVMMVTTTVSALFCLWRNFFGMRIGFSFVLLVGMIPFTIWVSLALSQNGQPAFVTFVAVMMVTTMVCALFCLWRNFSGMRICFSFGLLVGMISCTIWVSQKLSQSGQPLAFVTFMAVMMVTTMVCALFCLWRNFFKRSDGGGSLNPDSEFLNLTVDNFLNDMEREKPIWFTGQQLRIATDNYTNFLGSGGCGAVYKGVFSNGTMLAVKVLRGSSEDKKIEQQFMAEVGTIGRTHHINLVRLYGFCFERNLIALVYEYMANGSLDRFLFQENKSLGYDKLHEIAVGTARGIAYLHEECQQRIIHYDIKPGNILLDRNFNPKVADFGLAKLCNRENTHITMTGGRGTPGYAAPEVWMSFPITHKCDVYSFGMLLFEIIGRRRNHDIELHESQEWFPISVWKMFDAEELGELMTVCGVDEENKEVAERMVKVALVCVQYKPESRPIMSVVVKMLEGSDEIPKPLNPFQHLMDGSLTANPVQGSQTYTTTVSSSSSVVVSDTNLCATPVLRKNEIELASSI